MSQIFPTSITGGGGGSPGGSSPQIQFNNGGSFGGTTALEYDTTTPALRGLNTLTGGYRVFNTAAVTGNTEFGSMYWASNTLRIGSDITGTGTRREVQVGTFNAGTGQSYIRMLASGSTIMQYLVPNSATVSQIGHYFNNAGAYTASSGTQTLVQCAFTVNQSGTAGYNLLDLAATETGTGSGVRNLLVGRVGGNNRFRFDSTGGLTFSQPATDGISYFNTADEVTNRELFRLNWASNVLQMLLSQTGTGTVREMRLGNTANFFRIFPASNGTQFQTQAQSSSVVAANGVVRWEATSTASSGAHIFQQALNVVNQSATAGYTALDVSVTETSTGSGTKRLIDCRVGGNPRWSITNLGVPLYTPSATQSLLAANAITVDRGMIKVQGSGGAVTLTSTPTIAAGVEGEVIFIVGQSNTNTVTVQDRGTLASSNLRLGATTRTLGNGDVLALVYDGSLWSEMYFANNL